MVALVISFVGNFNQCRLIVIWSLGFQETSYSEGNICKPGCFNHYENAWTGIKYGEGITAVLKLLYVKHECPIFMVIIFEGLNCWP